MMTRVLQPEEVKRDEFGFWSHSALRALDDEQSITELPGAEGLEFHFVEFFDDAPAELLALYDEAGVPSSSARWEDAVRQWQPTPPAGEGWFLLGVYETEEGGPEACFVRPKSKEAAG